MQNIVSLLNWSFCFSIHKASKLVCSNGPLDVLFGEFSGFFQFFPYTARCNHDMKISTQRLVETLHPQGNFS